MLISQSEYARRKGKTRQYVQKLVKQGKIQLVGDQIDPDAADKALAQKAERPVRVDTVRPQSTGQDFSGSYIQAKTVRETYKAKIDKLEYEKLAGKLVETDAVLEAAENAFATVRVRVRGLAKSLSPILAITNKPAECERLLLDAIDTALEGLSTDVFTHDS